MHVLLIVVATLTLQDSLPLDRLTPAIIDAYMDRHLAAANRDLDALLRARGPRTIENTLRPYDAMRGRINGTGVVSVLRRAHADSAIRAACERAEARRQEFTRGLRLDPRLYRMILAIDTTNADAETREYLLEERTAFRRAGVDRDDATRARIAALRTDQTHLQQRFEANIDADTTSLAFDEADLAGMGVEWIAARKRGAQGGVIVVGEELQAVARQATSPAIRERALIAALNRAPANRAVLDTLLRTRYALATLLGYRSWAAYQLETSMVGTPDSARAFLDGLQRIVAAALRRDYDARRGARPWLSMSEYIEGQARGLGAGGLGPALRPYFPYAQVRDGLFGLARELMGLEFRPAPDRPGWSPSVETFRVYDGGRLTAIIYFDVHAQRGRSVQGAFTGVLRGSVRGGTTPVEGAIVGGMVPAGGPGAGLMGPQGVVTLFHEFGHLLHVIVSVRPWYWTSGFPPEGDFSEVPSTLFEQWAHDTAVLHRIARHYQTGAPAPDSLLLRMAAAPQGSGITQLWRARMSLELHDGSPDRVDSIVRATFAASQPPGVDVRLPDAEIHPEDTFFHLSSYQAAFYTYVWSGAISQDILSRFGHGLLDTTMVHAYRRELLDVGGSRPAMTSLRAFLGRPFNLDALAKTLQ